MQFGSSTGCPSVCRERRPRPPRAFAEPWPERLLAFEPTWARLAELTHLVALDLPGSGHSQRRDALLSPRAMGEFLVHFADAFGLAHLHIVGPEVGSSASLFAAAEDCV